MRSTEIAGPGALLGHARAIVVTPAVRAGGLARGGLGAALGGARLAGRVVPHVATSIFSDLSPTALADAITKALVSGFFHSLLSWVSDGAASLVGVLASVLSSSTEPLLSSNAFGSEFGLMAMLSAAVALPLVAVGAIQAIVRQEPGTLLRSVCVRLPLALLFTGVSVQIVALGLTVTDQASSLLLGADGDPARQLLTGLVTGLSSPSALGLAAFAEFLLVLSAGVIAFLLWLELAVRSAAISAASLFLPLALVGLAWPATAHWARRLGETLAALVLSKLVIAAVLALAAGLLVDSSGVAAVVQGVALLAMAAFAPFALLKLVPVVEAGAVAHLEGLGRRSLRAAENVGTQALGLEGGGVAALAGLGGVMARGVRSLAGSGEKGSNEEGSGPWTDSRPVSGGISMATGSTSVAPVPTSAGSQLAEASKPSVETAEGPASLIAQHGSADRPVPQNVAGMPLGAAPVTNVASSSPPPAGGVGPENAQVVRPEAVNGRKDQGHG